MGLFDVGTIESPTDWSGYSNASDPYGVEAAIASSQGAIDNTQSSFFADMFGGATLAPDGTALIDQRANTSFFTFDQSKVSASIFDVMKSGVEAATRVAVQRAGDSINSTAKQNSIWGQLAANFRSTKTGQQINAASYATRAQNFLMNPIVWLGAVVLIALLFVFKRG